MISKKNRRGFTLLETILVVSLLSVVSLAIMPSFLQGLRVFDRFATVSEDMELAVLIERLTHDLRNGIEYSPVPWSSSAASLNFPSMTAQTPADNDIVPTLIGYRYDADTKKVIRSSSLYPYNAVSENRVLAGNVQSLQFDLIRNREDKAPSRVTVSVQYGDGTDTRFFKKSIVIPASYMEPSA